MISLVFLFCITLPSANDVTVSVKQSPKRLLYDPSAIGRIWKSMMNIMSSHMFSPMRTDIGCVQSISHQSYLPANLYCKSIEDRMTGWGNGLLWLLSSWESHFAASLLGLTPNNANCFCGKQFDVLILISQMWCVDSWNRHQLNTKKDQVTWLSEPGNTKQESMAKARKKKRLSGTGRKDLANLSWAQPQMHWRIGSFSVNCPNTIEPLKMEVFWGYFAKDGCNY